MKKNLIWNKLKSEPLIRLCIIEMKIWIWFLDFGQLLNIRNFLKDIAYLLIELNSNRGENATK